VVAYEVAEIAVRATISALPVSSQGALRKHSYYLDSLTTDRLVSLRHSGKEGMDMSKKLIATMAVVAVFVTGGSPAYAGVDPGDLCKEAKAKATGKKAFDLLKAFGKNTKKPNTAELDQDISKAQSKFTKGFIKAEGKSGCLTSGDSGAIEAKVDAFVLDAIWAIPPYCGDGMVAPSEECDGLDFGALWPGCPPELPVGTVVCDADCRIDTSNCSPTSGNSALDCQRTIERVGMLYADEILDQIETCTAPGQTASLRTCLGSSAVQQRRSSIRTHWGSATASPCAGVNVWSDLGYLQTCAAAPSSCTFSSAVFETPGLRNDLLDCLACKLGEHLEQAGVSLFGDSAVVDQCHASIAVEGLRVLRTSLQQLDTCVQQPGATSVAVCYDVDLTAWRAQAESDCAGMDPFTNPGYPQLCSGVAPTPPGYCAINAYPCAFGANSNLSAPGTANDLLDCITCQTEEGVVAVARDLHGANLCCTTSGCDTILTRHACREAAGTPVYYRIDEMLNPLGVPVWAEHAHGIDVGPDGWLYYTDSSAGGSYGVMKMSPEGGFGITVGETLSWPTGVVLDAAGNIYVTERDEHQVVKITPEGQTSVFAGTGEAGHSGDGGPATGAKIVSPDGIAVDPDGNVYFTESGLLQFYSEGIFTTASERVRVVDPSGTIHTLAGQDVFGVSGEDGPAESAQLYVPYSMRWGYDGTLLVGEDGAMRALRIDSSGTLTRVAGQPFDLPIGSHSGDGGPAKQARLYNSCGIAGDPDGNVLIASHQNARISLVDRLGSIITIAGTGMNSSWGSGSRAGLGGPAVLAEVGCPEDIVVAPNGRVYYVDYGWPPGLPFPADTFLVLTREPY